MADTARQGRLFGFVGEAPQNFEPIIKKAILEADYNAIERRILARHPEVLESRYLQDRKTLRDAGWGKWQNFFTSYGYSSRKS